jgi:hypothetical protein
MTAPTSSVEASNPRPITLQTGGRVCGDTIECVIRAQSEPYRRARYAHSERPRPGDRTRLVENYTACRFLKSGPLNRTEACYSRGRLDLRTPSAHPPVASAVRVR